MKRTGYVPSTLATCLPGRKTRGVLPPRWLVTDARRLPDPLPAMRQLRPGDGVLFRHYELPLRERLDLARRVGEVCRQRRLIFLVAGDIRLARAVAADGVHLPQALVSRAAGARRAGLRLVTAAAHDAGAIARAARCGADAVMVSPVFATASHPGSATLGILGFAALATAARRFGMEPYALGGMTPCQLHRLRHISPAGYAAIAAFAGS